VRFIPLQVDTKFFSPGQTSPNGPILTVGDDGARDFPTLLRALDGLDVDLVAKTRQLSAAPTGLPRVQVISNRMRWPDYRALIASARFVVVPLVAVPHASGVNSVLEAMAMGKAVITCDSPGIRDYAIADRTALVVPCGDAEAMRSAILRLMTDDVLCERLGRCARQFVEQHCSYASVAEQTAAFVREVVESHRS
jgi:glycosyltransferase involved in cell wall biosynthesis